LETKKSRIHNAHVWGETVEPEKLYYKKQKDDRDVYSRNEEAVARKRSNLNETEEEQL
jgi:hypothetical protein